MKFVLMSLLSLLVGLIVLVAMLCLVELFSAVVHPFPEGFGGTEQEICEHVMRYPAWILAAVVPMWAGAAFLSVWLTGRIGNLYSAGLVGLLTLAGLILNLSMLPYPIWFKIVCLLTIPLGIFVALRSCNKGEPAQEPGR